MKFSHSITVLKDQIKKLQEVVAEREKEMEEDQEMAAAYEFLSHDVINGKAQIEQHQEAIKILLNQAQ